MKNKYFFAVAVACLFVFSGCITQFQGDPIPKACDDGTFFEKCSATKPLFCDNGKLVENPVKCNCPSGQILRNSKCVLDVKCIDGTENYQCSILKRYKCIDGNLIENAKECGCPENYEEINNSCVEIKRCPDGTKYGQCSRNKPMLCEDGKLVSKSSICGCFEGYTVDKDSCIEKYKTNAEKRFFKYTFNGKNSTINITVYKDLSMELSKKDRTLTCYAGTCPSDDEITKILTKKKLEDPFQDVEMDYLISKIKLLDENKDNRARIAISIVQNIPYDYESLEKNELKDRYPYEVLYDNKGVCGEKAPLLALLLEKLGYSAVLFNFETENHQSVGLKCPVEYSYKNSGYCFVESTVPMIITNSEEEYLGAGKLTSNPLIIEISNGSSFDSVENDYKDKVEWRRIMKKIDDSYNNIVDSGTYNKWKELVEKYGLPVSS